MPLCKNVQMCALDTNRQADNTDEGLDNLLLDAEFIIAKMLKMVVNLDYVDKIRRRKMFQLMRDMIGQEGLPES